jgi:hypothetical protein
MGLDDKSDVEGYDGIMSGARVPQHIKFSDKIRRPNVSHGALQEPTITP